MKARCALHTPEHCFKLECCGQMASHSPDTTALKLDLGAVRQLLSQFVWDTFVLGNVATVSHVPDGTHQPRE